MNERFIVEVIHDRFDLRNYGWIIRDTQRRDARCYLSYSEHRRCEAYDAERFSTRQSADSAACILNIRGEGAYFMRKSVLADIALFG